jgi:ABC-2 type transport system permease protein
MTAPEGQIFDLGYQRYDGPREGRMRARKALFVNGIRTSFGIGRGALSKVLPILFFGAVMTPALILALIAATIDQLGGPVPDIPGPADYYQIVSVILFIFSAIIAPELLCSDRRNGVISLYMVRPLSATDYVIGRWAAFFVVSLVFIYAGQALLQVGLILGAPEPLEYFKDNWSDIPRFLAAGVVIALITTTIPLAVASFTNRRAYASAFVIGLFILSSVVAEILVECPDEHNGAGPPIQLESCEPLTGDFAKYAGLIAIGRTPIHVSDMIFDKDNDSELSVEVAKLNDGIPILWYLFVTIVPGIILWQRYRRISS